MWTEEDKKFLIENYGKISGTKISVILKQSKNLIKYWAKKLDLHSSIRSGKRHFRNKDTFSNLTLETCYWAGFIAADGCITDKNVLVVCLSNVDKNHLEK